MSYINSKYTGSNNFVNSSTTDHADQVFNFFYFALVCGGVEMARDQRGQLWRAAATSARARLCIKKRKENMRTNFQQM